MGLPGPSGEGVYLVGPRVLVSLWGRSVGVHVGAGLLLGTGGGDAARVALANARFALAGPRLGAARLDIELGVEAASLWAAIDETGGTRQSLGAILTADLVVRLPLSRAWGLSFDLGYRRAYGGDVADLVAVSAGVTRALW